MKYKDFINENVLRVLNVSIYSFTIQNPVYSIAQYFECFLDKIT